MACDARTAHAGLTSEQAAAELSRSGRNVVAGRRRDGVIRKTVRQLRDPLILVLLGAALVTALTAQLAETVVIMLVIVGNTAVGVIQEVRADRAVEALADLAPAVAHVRRDGALVALPVDEVVVGDVLELRLGDVVAADCRLVESVTLLVDESALTGESFPVEKDVVSTPSVLAGAFVVGGRGIAVVERTGATSAVGRIAALLDTDPPATPLQRRMDALGRAIAGLVIACCVVVLLSGLARGESFELMVITAVSLAVAAVPESLPAVVTLALAMAAHRLARRGGIVRRLSAVESLGSVTLFATDKTGTLTAGRMRAVTLWTPRGTVDLATHPADADHSLDEVRLAEDMALCNDAIPTPAGATGQPTDAALMDAAAAVVDVDAVNARYPRVHEQPFDSRRKRMTTMHRREDGAARLVVKGALDGLLASDVISADDPVVERALEVARTWSADGSRVIAVASRDGLDGAEPAGDGVRCALDGLVRLDDPLRDDAAPLIATLRDAGVDVALVSGDDPRTVGAVAEALGLPGRGPVVDLGRTSVTAGADSRVLGRATPEHKVELVEAWQSADEIVAMTGDGVNDGPALHRADVGIAMGRRGTEVARQAADLVLSTDDLGSLVDGVSEGRRVHANVGTFLLYGLSGGLSEVAVMLVGPWFGLALPLLPTQILWINLLTHGLVGVAVGSEPAADDVLAGGPVSLREPALGRRTMTRIAVLGSVIACAAIAAALVAVPGEARTATFLAVAAGQLAVAFVLRVRHPAARDAGARPWLLLAVLGALLVMVASITVPVLRTLLDTVVPAPRTVLTAAVAALAAGVATWLTGGRSGGPR